MEVETKKPKLKAKNIDGNIFAVVGAASKALREVGQGDKAKELQTKVMSKAGSYHEALAIVLEYVDIV